MGEELFAVVDQFEGCRDLVKVVDNGSSDYVAAFVFENDEGAPGAVDWREDFVREVFDRLCDFNLEFLEVDKLVV